MSIFNRFRLASKEDICQENQLRPMTPKYDSSQHGRYVGRLNDALYKQNCKNVALSGSYGSGKSSILEQFAKEAKANGHYIAKVSLANFCTEPLATVCTNPSTDESDSKPSTTALLEREILGQLLYQGNPLKASKSSFNQVHNIPLYRQIPKILSLSLVLFTAIIIAVLLPGALKGDIERWFNALASMNDDSLHHCLLQSIAIAAVAFVLTTIISSCLLSSINRLHLKSISASGLNLSLDKEVGDSSYFNKYRDELIYLFEINKYDTVIFEDIDRFDDLRIFDELRKLNELLNLAPGIVGKTGKKAVRFVYAVKDSIFTFGNESKGTSKEVLGSGRVKFFDMVISVVPFISKFNANEMAAKVFASELKDAGQTDEGTRYSDLLLLAAPYIADMRLMVSIRNDYLVMTQEMGSPSFGHHSSLGLTCTGILAIAIYKNLYPLEYEDLRIGEGKLNELYDIHQKGINRLLPQYLAATKLVQRFKEHGDLVDEVAETLGNELKEALDERVYSINCLSIGNTSFDTRSNYSDSIYRKRFWGEFFSLGPEECLYIGHGPKNGYEGVRLTKREFLDLVGIDLPDIGMKVLLNDGFSDTSFANLDSKTEQLRTADFYTKQDLLCPINTNAGEECLESFAKIVKQTIGDELVCELIKEGYIRKDFDLYISKYPTDAKPRVVNFIYHCYQRGVQDLDYFLDDEDCSAVLKIIPTVHLDRPCCFNRYLLSHILSGGDASSTKADCDALITTVNGIVANFTSSGKQLIERLLEEYPDNKGLLHKFISALLNQTQRAFDILVDSSENVCTTQSQRELVSYALANMNLDTSYECELSSSWMSTNIEAMSIADAITDETRADAVANFLSRCSITIHELSTLGTELGSSVAELGNYDVSRANLLFACRASNLPTLDSLEEAYPSVYKRVVSSEDALNSYLTALNPDEYSIAGFPPFIFTSLCRAAESWSDSANIEELANSIIAKIKLEGGEVNLSELEPGNSIDNTNAMGIALIRELVLNQKAAGTLSNVSFILKLESADELSGELSLFDRFIKEFSIYEMFDNQTLGATEVLDIANGLLFKAHPTSTNLFNAMTRLRVINGGFFPLTIDKESLGKMLCDDQDIVELTERNFIGPTKIVYEYLEGPKWNFRRKILKKLLKDNPIRNRSILPQLFSYDLPRIVSSAKTWGSWLAVDIASYPHYYLDQSCKDDSEKAKVIAVIEDKAEKHDLL